MKKDPLDVFLASYSRETRENVLSLRNLIRNVFPNGMEHINPRSGTITYGLDKKANGAFIYAIVPHMKHITLILSKGTKIADPANLLCGTGKETRHLKIKSEAETQNPALKALLEEALRKSK